MDVKLIPLDQIHPYEKNPRKNDEAVDKVAASIREFGFRQPIVVDADHVIIAGHTRLEASKRLGLPVVPVVVADDLSEEQVKAYRLADFFDREDHHDTEREEGNEEYNEFLDKFENKKTTDDCYTPDLVYEAVADWVVHEYGVDRSKFVRPFYPGGDYQRFKYEPGAIVVDNPPFSILAEILRWYKEHEVNFFLFGPTLTLFSSSSGSCCAIPTGVSVTYENGAVVHTSFLTSLEADDLRVRTAPSLYKVVDEANREWTKGLKKELPKYSYPDEIITSAMVARWSKYGIDFSVSVAETEPTSALDAQKTEGKAIFGKGYLLSERAAAERAAAERAAAERAAAERAAATRWPLSERERAIVKRLGQKDGKESDMETEDQSGL